METEIVFEICGKEYKVTGVPVTLTNEGKSISQDDTRKAKILVARQVLKDKESKTKNHFFEVCNLLGFEVEEMATALGLSAQNISSWKVVPVSVWSYLRVLAQDNNPKSLVQAIAENTGPSVTELDYDDIREIMHDFIEEFDG